MNEELIIPLIVYIGIFTIGMFITILSIGLHVISLLKERNDIMMDQYDYENNRIGNLSNDSKQFHEFIKFIITETAVVKFKRYLMNNDINKSNRTAVQQIIKEIATEVFEALQNNDTIYDEQNLLNKDYYIEYITDLTIITVDKMLDDIV